MTNNQPSKTVMPAKTLSVISTEWEEIGPEKAEQYLNTMRVNRKLSDFNLKKIRDAMLRGKWHADGDPIRFNERGELVDGQHRLWAIIDLGLTFTFAVMRNVPLDAMSTMNTGKSRSMADIITLYDPQVKDVNNVAALATISYRWELGVRGSGLRNAFVSNDDVVNHYMSHRLEMSVVNKTARRVQHSVKGCTTQAWALTVWLFNRIDEPDSTYFWERLIDGVGLEAGNPILALRELMSREQRSARPTMRVDTAAALIIKAWNAYREGREIRLLAFKAGGATPERFPEPV